MGPNYSGAAGSGRERRESGIGHKSARKSTKGGLGLGCFSPPREPGMEACKRDKPMFAGVFGFCKRDIRRVCHACKGEFWPMFIVLVTLSRFRFPAAVRTVTAPLHRWG